MEKNISAAEIAQHVVLDKDDTWVLSVDLNVDSKNQQIPFI